MLMYFTDPVSGRRRRAYARDKGIHARKFSAWYTRKQARNVGNHLQGVIAEITSRFQQAEPPNDPKLESRVRSELGRFCSQTSGLEVHAHGGIVTLRGKVPSTDLARVYAKARTIRGVKRVINELEGVTRQDEKRDQEQSRAATQTQPLGLSGSAMLH
jgi:hypothetical protein